MTTIFLSDKDLDGDGNIVNKDLRLQGVTSLYFLPSAAKKLIQLINLPEGLQKIGLDGCINLQIISNFPRTLQKIGLSGCYKLEKSEGFSGLMSFLDEIDCEIIYPDKTTSIGLIEAKIAKINQSEFPAFHSLVKRYLSENLDQREGKFALLKNVGRVLDILESSPDHYSWVEDLSQKFSFDGCINQPVAGFFQIATWLNASTCEGKISKIEALTPLMVNNLIIYSIKTDPEIKISVSYEVELGMCLLKKFYERRSVEKMIPVGVPKKINNEDKVSGVLSDDKIESLYSNLLKETKKTSLEKVEFFSSDENSRIWGGIAFPKVMKNIKDFHSELRGSGCEDGTVYSSKRFHAINSLEESAILEQVMKLTKIFFPTRSPSLPNLYSNLSSVTRNRSASL
ncbi:MAG: hypothetical protein ACJA02_000932 [Myxococcota bacterium]|jgi:hypothetical protein